MCANNKQVSLNLSPLHRAALELLGESSREHMLLHTQQMIHSLFLEFTCVSVHYMNSSLYVGDGMVTMVRLDCLHAANSKE